MHQAMKADANVVIKASGKNEQVRKVFRTLFVVMAGQVLAHVVDPATVQQVVGMIRRGIKKSTDAVDER